MLKLKEYSNIFNFLEGCVFSTFLNCDSLLVITVILSNTVCESVPVLTRKAQSM